MGDEEDDYMSASFIQSATPQQQQESSSKGRGRGIPQRKKGPEKTKSFKELEAESIRQGLASALNQENKGFRMLKMMGYKEGSGLGKDESGKVDAIPLNVKRSRSGLGEEEGRKRKLNKLAEKRVKLDEKLLASFKGSMKGKFNVRKLSGQLKAIKTICKNMDEDKGITTNELTTEPTEEETKEKEKEEEEPDPEKMLEEFVALHEYARNQHFYCFFCGIRYENEEDMTKNCPGLLEEDHD